MMMEGITLFNAKRTEKLDTNRKAKITKGQMT